MSIQPLMHELIHVAYNKVFHAAVEVILSLYMFPILLYRYLRSSNGTIIISLLYRYPHSSNSTIIISLLYRYPHSSNSTIIISLLYRYLHSSNSTIIISLLYRYLHSSNSTIIIANGSSGSRINKVKGLSHHSL